MDFRKILARPITTLQNHAYPRAILRECAHAKGALRNQLANRVMDRRCDINQRTVSVNRGAG